MYVNLNGRIIPLTPQQYSRAVKRQKELADKGRRLSLELKREGPRGHRNSFWMVSGRRGDFRCREEVNNNMAWKASKQNRLNESFSKLINT